MWWLGNFLIQLSTHLLACHFWRLFTQVWITSRALCILEWAPQCLCAAVCYSSPQFWSCIWAWPSIFCQVSLQLSAWSTTIAPNDAEVSNKNASNSWSLNLKFNSGDRGTSSWSLSAWLTMVWLENKKKILSELNMQGSMDWMHCSGRIKRKLRRMRSEIENSNREKRKSFRDFRKTKKANSWETDVFQTE